MRTRRIAYPEESGYNIPDVALSHPPVLKPSLLTFNEGLPDERIAPLTELARAYRNVFNRGSRTQFSYSGPAGNPTLRKQISLFLNESRGLQTSPDNILITRGSQMAIYLASRMLIVKGDTVATGQPGYRAADEVFETCGATLLRLPLDDRGLDVDRLERYCKSRKVRAVYVTPHHHFPTTITLSACRRMKLLSLAEKFGFVILEDEYDYDFHYKSAPILPLATADHKGMVITFGSMSKSFSPALRVGWVVAPANVIRQLAKIRSVIDRQGDFLLEQAVAELYKDGTVNRYLRKALQVYHDRRDHLANELRLRLSPHVSFDTPEGGLALWVRFSRQVPLSRLAPATLANGLWLDDGRRYDPHGQALNSTRLGFASINFKEIDKAVAILRASIDRIT